MSRASTPLAVAVFVVTLGVSACSDRPSPLGPDLVPGASATASASADGRHVVVFRDEAVPADFAARVAMLGAQVEYVLGDLGVATVVRLTPESRTALAADAAIANIEADIVMELEVGGPQAGDAAAELPAHSTLPVVGAASSPASAAFFARQWNMRAVGAHDAWAAGHLGASEVVVAIMDTGIDYLHPDLTGLVDLGRSKSFTPAEDPIVQARYPGRHPSSDLFWHGTASASIVASNGIVVAGTNQTATLLSVKIADRAARTSSAQFFAGLMHAIQSGADVVNISGGQYLDRSRNPGMIAAFQRALNRAHRNGAVVVSVALHTPADRDRDSDGIALPCEAAHVICVSATAPTAALGVDGPWVNVDASAPYAAFGRSLVDVVAPGGDGAPTQFRRIWLPCTTTPGEFSPAPCRAGQPVTAGLGASWSAAHVSGLAALLVAKHGHGKPAMIRELILQSAEDLGEPGTDPYYGRGRIDLARALGVR